MATGIVKCTLMAAMVVLTSLYFFPLGVKWLPGTNTKMLMAALGLGIYLYNISRGRLGEFGKDAVRLSLVAALVSLIGFASAVYNNTRDYAYATYIVSMWVWIGGAYAVISCIRKVHGSASIRIVGNYLVAVCVAQCALALLIDSVPAVRQFAHSILGNNLFVERVNRLYGIGAALDVAGSRFSAVLIIIAVFITRLREDESRRLLPVYLLCFLWIGVVGNMIARTTTIGLVIGIAYFAYKSRLYTFRIPKEYNRLAAWLGGLLVLAVPLVIYFYNADENFRHDFRFAFEGFFSLVEEGSWDVASNNKLRGMYVFPETLKTWIIGDGYFANPVYTDPYFTGRVVSGFYMGTDVGYLRFIFYFGLIGLAAITGVFLTITGICRRRFPHYGDLFLLLLVANLVIWFKVSTDIFPAFAPFFLLDAAESDACDQRGQAGATQDKA